METEPIPQQSEETLPSEHDLISDLKQIEDQQNKEKTRQMNLKKFYQEHFPFELIERWLSYRDLSREGVLEKGNFVFREISFMIRKLDFSEFVIRHLCYDSWAKFKEDVVTQVPVRIDIGAVFDLQPMKNKQMVYQDKAKALDREYVIDIDMSDYDLIRTCCTGKTVCKKCWRFLVLAQKVLKMALKEQFGFKDILWIFSGRRGIHAWVCDQRARIMNNQVRAAVTDFLDITVSNDNTSRLVKNQVVFNDNYAFFNKSYQLLEENFEDFIIEEQQYLANDKNVLRLCEIMKFHSFVKGFEDFKQISLTSSSSQDQNKDGNKAGKGQPRRDERTLTPEQQRTLNLLKDKISQEYDEILKFDDSESRWSHIKYFMNKNSSFINGTRVMKELVIGLLFPKIDSGVSAQTNHLLKCPFNIHHSTDKLSFPIDDEKIDDFDPNNVPTLESLVNGTDSMVPYLKKFEEFCEKQMRSQAKESRLVKQVDKVRQRNAIENEI